MLRQLLLLLAISLMAASCTKKIKEPVVSLKMELSGLTDSTNVILYQLDDTYVEFDTARQGENGCLYFTRPIVATNFFLLKLPNGQQLPLILHPTTTLLRADATNLVETVIFAANPESEAIRKALILSKDFEVKLGAITHQLTDTLRPRIKVEIKDSIIQYIDTLKREYSIQMEALIKDRPALSALPIILHRIGNQSFFNPVDHRQLFIETDTFLARHYFYLKSVKDFHYHLDSVFNRVDSVLSINRGDQLPDAGLPNIWGERLSLFKFRGHPLLIIVWESSDSTSRELIPQTKRIIKDLKPQGMDVYMVSLDTLKSTWSGAIDQYRLACWHVNDLQGLKSPVITRWGIRSVPSVIVLNENGEIVEKNIHGDQLDSCLVRLLKK